MTEGNGDIRKLPKGWTWTRLGNLGKIVAGGTPSTKNEEYWGNEVFWVSPADLSGYKRKFISRGRKSLSKLGLENSSAKLMSAGSILFSSRAPIGYVVISANEICTNQGFKSLVPSKEIFNEYIYYYLKASKQLAEKYASGTTFKELSGKSFSILPIPLPPHKEQKRIVERIEELFSDIDQGVESLKTAQKQLKVYRQAVLKWAFEGKLTEAWRKQRDPSTIKTGEALLTQIKAERENRDRQQLAEWEEAVEMWEAIGKVGKKPTKPQKLQEPSPLTTTELAVLPALPLEWCYVRAEAICDFITKGTTPSKEQLFSGSGDVPFIKVYNLTDSGSLDFTVNPTFVSTETHNGFLNRSKVLPSDVLMNIVDPPLGKVSLVPNTFNEWNINQAIVRYRALNVLLSKYLMYYLLSQVTIDRMSKRAKATAGQFNLTLEICRNTEVPICSPEEQEEIIQEIESRLSICDQLEATITENLQKAEALRQSILKQAFEGKLVPQDPNDEPAEKLLEQIRLEQ